MSNDAKLFIRLDFSHIQLKKELCLDVKYVCWRFCYKTHQFLCMKFNCEGMQRDIYGRCGDRCPTLYEVQIHVTIVNEIVIETNN